MSQDITIAEMDVDLLPERQTLWGFSFASPVIFASNASETVQALTVLSLAKSTAVQTIVVF